MFDLPSREDVCGCVITADAVNGEADPVLVNGVRQRPGRVHREENEELRGFLGDMEPIVS